MSLKNSVVMERFKPEIPVSKTSGFGRSNSEALHPVFRDRIERGYSTRKPPLLATFGSQNRVKSSLVEISEQFKTALTKWINESDTDLTRSADGYRMTLDGLLELFSDPDPEAVPSADVKTFTKSILEQVQRLMNCDFPYGDTGPDMMNGLDIDWESTHRRVRLVVPADSSRRRYVYFREGDKYDVADATPQELAVRLDWLSEDA